MESTPQSLAIKLTSNEIKGKEFEKTFRGYSPTEVRDFLELLSGCWERLQKQEKHLLDTLQSVQTELESWRTRETEMRQLRESSLKEAQAIREEAQKIASQQIQEAEERANNIRERTENWLEDVIAKVEETQRRKSNFVTAFQSALDSHYELLKQDLQNQTPIGEELTALLQEKLQGMPTH